MKILWIGKYASENIFNDMAKKGYYDPASQVSQSNIINAFDKLCIDVDTINAYNVSSTYRDKYIIPQKWSRTGKSTDISIGYYNIKYLSHLLITAKLKKEIYKWAKNNQNEVVILVYGMQSSLIASGIKAKYLMKKSKLYLIVPDLPQYMSTKTNFIKSLLKKIDWIKIKLQLKKVDGYILYAYNMAKFLKLNDKQWIVMEGSINPNESIDILYKAKKTKKIIVMYSGKIDEKFGIIELLEATKFIKNDNYEFWFSGFGNAVNKVKKYSMNDKRIKYLGFITSRTKLLNKQNEATMLMNMRLPSEKSSEFCFPSKLFEYMLLGKPVLTFKIKGIPQNYYDYLIEMESTTPKDIANTIIKVGMTSEKVRNEIGLKGKNFVLKNKNSIAQAERILKFIHY